MHKAGTQDIGSAIAAMRLIEQSFNYSILGATGFERLADLVETAPAWELEYASLDDAAQILNGLLIDHG